MIAAIRFNQLVMISEFPTDLDALVGIADFLEEVGFEFWNTYSPDSLDEFEPSDTENLFFLQDLLASGFEVYVYNNICYSPEIVEPEVLATVERDMFVKVSVQSALHPFLTDLIHYDMLELMRTDIIRGADGEPN